MITSTSSSTQQRRSYDIPWDAYIIRVSESRGGTWEFRVFDRMDPSCRFLDFPDEVRTVLGALHAWIDNKIDMAPADYLHKLFGADDVA